MPKDSLARRAPLLLLCSWLALLFGQNLIWLDRNVLQSPPPWDPALYLFMGLRYWHVLTEQGLGALWSEIRDPLLVPYVPPLFPLSTLPLFFLFGESRLAAYATSSLYLCVMLLGTYLLARRRHGQGAGYLALFLASTFSAPINLSRDYQMDLPAAALLCLAVWSLLRSEDFRRAGPSLAFGGLAGLALLTKTMSGPFLVPPALWALVRGWRSREERGSILRNSGLALAAAALVASAWWGTHGVAAARYLLEYGWGQGADPYVPSGAGLLSLPSLTYYVTALANDGASVPYFLLMAVLLVEGAMRRFRRERGAAPADSSAGVHWAWLLGGYLLLTLSRNKTADRYVILLVPPVAVLMAGAVWTLPRAAWRRIAVSAAVLMGIANYVASTWPGAGLPPLRWRPPLGLAFYRHGQAWLRAELHVPTYGWPLPAIVAALARSAGPTKARLLPTLKAEELARERSPDERVRIAYRRLLRREPDPTGLAAYSGELRARTRSTAQILDALAASDEFADRPLRVLVVPDHPFVNASTLRYYAEAARARVAFDRVDPGRSPPLPLQDFDALVVKDGGYQGPAFSTRHAPWVEVRLHTDDAGFERVPGAFPCPDGSSLLLYTSS